MADLLLLPSKNTYVTNQKPDKNFNNSSMLYAGTDANGYTYRSLLVFDLSLLPQDITIESATLGLYADLGGYKSNPGFFTPFIVIDSWGTQEVTWNKQPDINVSVAGKTIEISRPGWCYWDITNIVQLWVLNSLNNYGLQLKAVEGQLDDIKGFYSAASYYHRNYRPFIEIKYNHRNSISLGSRNTTHTVEICKTTEDMKFSNWQNTSSYSLYTFFVQNIGQHPACIFLQVSPDRVAAVNEPYVIHLPPGSTEAMVPQKFGFFTRLACKPSFSGRYTTLRIWFQAQV